MKTYLKSSQRRLTIVQAWFRNPSPAVFFLVVTTWLILGYVISLLLNKSATVLGAFHLGAGFVSSGSRQLGAACTAAYLSVYLFFIGTFNLQELWNWRTPSAESLSEANWASLLASIPTCIVSIPIVLGGFALGHWLRRKARNQPS